MKNLGMVVLVTAVAMGQVTAAGAQVIGSGALKGPLSFAVKQCGADRGRVQVDIVVAPDGTWTAGTGEGLPLGGTSQPLGKSGRKLALAFDAESVADFVAARANDIEAGCDVSGVVIDSAAASRFLLTLNRKRTRATLTVVYTLRGSAGGTPSKATFRLRAAGPWTGA